MVRTPHLLLLAGVTLVLYGYWWLAVPPDALYEVVLFRVKAGVLSVVGGSVCLAAWLAKR